MFPKHAQIARERVRPSPSGSPITVATIFSLILRVKDDERIKCPILTVQELEQAEEFCCRSAQELAFLDEISSLKTKGNL